MSPRTLRPLLGASIALMAGLLAGPASADSTNDAELAALEQKKGELADRLNRLDTVSAAHGQYVALRDGALLGDGGISSQVTAFYAAATKWITDWQVTLASLDRVDDLARPDVRDALQKRILDHTKDGEALRATAYALATNVTALDRKLAAVPTLGTSTVPAYGAQAAFLDAQKEKLRTAVDLATTVGSPSILDRWSQISALSEKLVRLRIGQALAQAPELQSALADVETMYRADRLAGPLVQEVYDAYGRMRDAANGDRLFAARALQIELNATADRNLGKVREANLGARFTDPVVTLIENWRTTGNGFFNSRIKPFPPSVVVKRRFENSGAAVALKCRDGKARLTVNCELFQRVYRVPSTRISSMTPAELEYMDGLMDQVGKPAPR